MPDEPVQIGHESQFFVDDYIVDNRWALLKKDEALVRVAHQPIKHPANPLIGGEGGYLRFHRRRDDLFVRVAVSCQRVGEPGREAT